MKLIVSVDITSNDAGFLFDYCSEVVPPLPTPERYTELCSSVDEADVKESVAAMVCARLLAAVDNEWIAIKTMMAQQSESLEAGCSSIPETLH